jgi:hypothetical protein
MVKADLQGPENLMGFTRYLFPWGTRKTAGADEQALLHALLNAETYHSS